MRAGYRGDKIKDIGIGITLYLNSTYYSSVRSQFVGSFLLARGASLRLDLLTLTTQRAQLNSQYV